MIRLITILLLLSLFCKGADTGFLSPSATGEDYNTWSSPSNAYSSNNVYANTGGLQSQDWYNFNVPAQSNWTDIYIEVSAEGSTDGDGQNEVICCEVSWNGGSNYSTLYGDCETFNTYSDVTKTYGGPTADFGHTWLYSDLSNSNLRVRLSRNSGTNHFYLDHIQVKIYYTATAVDNSIKYYGFGKAEYIKSYAFGKLYELKNYRFGSGGTPPEPDTTEHIFFSQTFENWSTSTIQTPETLEDSLQHFMFSGSHLNGGGNLYDRMEIVTDGVQGNVLKATVPYLGCKSFEFSVPLGDTTSELWVQAKMKVDPEFDQCGPDGFCGFKANPIGFTMGGNYEFADQYPGGVADTSDIFDRYGWWHFVGGSVGLMGYLYLQAAWDSFEDDWVRDLNDPDLPWQDGYVRGDSGYLVMPTAGFKTYIGHAKLNDYGESNGYFEVYEAEPGSSTATLKIRYTGLRSRSDDQGDPWGKIEAINLSYFFGGDCTEGSTPTTASPRTQWIEIDDIITWKQAPTSHYAEDGATVQVKEVTGTIHPNQLLNDETYSASSDTVIDVGNNVYYIHNPPSDHGYVTKVISKTGTVNFTFLKEEFGYGNDGISNRSYWVKVYTGTGGGKTLQYTFGREDDGYTNPSGTYSLTGPLTIEIHTGWCGYDQKGVWIYYY